MDPPNRRTSGGNRSGLSSPYENPPAPSPHQQPGTKTTSAPTSPLKVLKKFMLSIQSSFFYHILAPNEFVENYFCTVTISNCWFAGTAWEQESLILRQGFKSFTGEMSYLNKNSIKSKTRWWVPKQMRPKTRRRRSKLKELRGTTGASPYLSLTTRTQTGQRLDHHSKQFKWEIVSMFWHFTELIWSPAVFPWKENPHRLGSSGGAGWVQGTDGNTISLLCKISFHNFRHNFSFWNVETSAKVTASSESGVTVCLPATRGGKMR